MDEATPPVHVRQESATVEFGLRAGFDACDCVRDLDGLQHRLVPVSQYAFDAWVGIAPRPWVAAVLTAETQEFPSGRWLDWVGTAGSTDDWTLFYVQQWTVDGSIELRAHGSWTLVPRRTLPVFFAARFGAGQTLARGTSLNASTDPVGFDDGDQAWHPRAIGGLAMGAALAGPLALRLDVARSGLRVPHPVHDIPDLWLNRTLVSGSLVVTGNLRKR